MGFVVLSVFYWICVAGLLLTGFIMLLVNSSKNLPLKSPLRLLVIGVIMIVIGAGACAAILSNLGGMH